MKPIADDRREIKGPTISQLMLSAIQPLKPPKPEHCFLVFCMCSKPREAYGGLGFRV